MKLEIPHLKKVVPLTDIKPIHQSYNPNIFVRVVLLDILRNIFAEITSDFEVW